MEGDNKATKADISEKKMDEFPFISTERREGSEHRSYGKHLRAAYPKN